MLAAGLLFLASGCASEQRVIEPPSASNERIETVGKNPAILNLNSVPQIETIQVGDTLSYEEALAKALLENPQLESFAWQIRVKEAERIQSSLLPNPEVEAEMENFGGTGPFEGMKSRETTIRLSQKILLGADRMKRKRVAGLNQKLAGWDYEIQRLNVLFEVTKAYITALEAMQQFQQQQDLLEVSQQFAETVSSQVEAGKVSGLEQTKAEVELSQARIQTEKMRTRMEAAFGNLASFWNSQSPAFKTLDGILNEPDQEIPGYEFLLGLINQNPDVARWATEIQQREASLSLERAKGLPDLKISGGYKRVEDVNAGAAIVGISIPLPFFDRNQGNVKAARYNLNKAEAQRESKETEVVRALQESYQTLEAAWYEVNQLKKNVLPGAEKAYEAAQTGYREGKFDLLDVLDAQRTLFSSRTSYIEALADYHRAVADVERLIGQPLNEISPTE